MEHRGSHQALAPLINGRPEPTHAVYSRACLAPLLRRLQSGRLKAGDILADLDVAYVIDEALQRVNPGLTSFFNVNTQEDLDRALDIAKGLPANPPTLLKASPKPSFRPRKDKRGEGAWKAQ